MIKNRVCGNDNYSLVGVFDGHGNQGHFISNLLKLFFSEYFSKIDLYKPDNKFALANINNSIKNCFSDLNNISNFTNNYDLNNGNFNLSNYSNNSITSNIYGAGMSSTKNYTKKTNLPIKNFPYNINNKDDPKEKFQNIFYEKLIEDNYSLIKNSFQLAEASFAQSKYDMNFSGSTCICVFIIEDRIMCANCGDSRAILVSSEKPKNLSKNNMQNNNNLNIILPLSIDHKPELKDEAYRILKSNGRIDKRSEGGIKTGPLRVWLKNENYPGLAMTRSIGDMVASKIGVTSEPDIIEFTINSESKFIVVASDGIWEIFTNEEVANIVNFYYNNMDVASAAEKLVEEAAKKWRKV